MNRIKQIKLKHFKFFYGEVTIDLERQNALIFGENGSGKSSLYWALYTFMQSVFKVQTRRRTLTFGRKLLLHLQANF